MRTIRTFLTLLLAVVWVPLTAHCQIESLTGLELLRCAPVEAGGDCGGTPCNDSCCTWESGQYHLPQSQPQVAPPLVAVSPQTLAAVTEDAPAAAVERVLADTPPESPKPWQFSYRAALPPRAPSFIA